MYKKVTKVLLIFCLTVILFGFIGNKLQEHYSASDTSIQISSDSSLERNSKRSQIYLNGVWQFIPASPASEQQLPKEGWGSILVPGDWQHENDDSVPGVMSRGTGKAWQNFNGQQLAKAWYQRTIKIPEAWQGRSILLDLRRVSTDAVVYANGIKCGQVEWPYGAVDITKAVKPGAVAKLAVLVVAVADEKEKIVFMGPNEAYTTKAGLESRGLIGEVRLIGLPKGPHVSDVFVQTSTRQKQVKLDVELTGITQAGQLAFVADMLNEKGEVERQFHTTAQVEAKPTQVLQLAWDWPNPRLWDVSQPNLYALRLAVRGSGIDDEYSQQFGFREFWIEGRSFYLNGTEIRLRPAVGEESWPSGIPEVADRMIDGYFFAGYNIAELWPWNHDERGKWHFRELFADRSDLKGFPLMVPVLDMTSIGSRQTWNSSARQRWERRMAKDLRRYRNHPSILLWASSPNFFGHSDDQNPRRIGKKKIEGTLMSEVEDKRLREIVPIGEEAVATIKKYDPTRSVMMHQGASVGDVYALNSYLNMIPLQEREEWLSDWTQHGDMPYMVVEFGTPLHATMMRARNGFSQAITSEPLMTEFSAIYLGKQAYELETPEYRAKIRELFVKNQEYQNWFGKRELNYAPAFQKLQQLFSTNTWRSWRTFGMTGGMIPWNNGHGWEGSAAAAEKVDIGRSSPEGRGPYLKQAPKSLWYYLQPEANIIQPGGQAIMQNNGPTLAWIAGSTTAIAAKDRNFPPGQRLQKQVVLINDTRSAQEFSFDWQVMVGGQQVGGGRKTGNIETAKTLFFPLEVDLPTSTTTKVDGEIYLSARIGQRQHEDRFAFRVFPKLPKATGTVAVLDSIGQTSRMLQQLGYTVVPWDGSLATQLLVIGREALSSGLNIPGNLAEFVRNGGRAIVFAQNPEWMKRLGFRLATHLTRRVFPVDGSHPALSGLDALDLRDWAGESTLVEAYPNNTNGGMKRSPHGPPWYGWHWSDRGVVSSASVEKPHRSSWRPILESEFDLAYTPLMELDYGKGRLIWNALDLEDHVQMDAAAARLAQQIVEYGAKAPLSPKADRVILIGNDADKAKLDSLGLIYQRSNSLAVDAELTIIGAGADVKNEDLQAYLKGGGKVFFLPRSSPSAALGVKLQQLKDFGSLPPLPKWPETRGISTSDLHSRTARDTWIFQSGGEVASHGLLTRISLGKGVAIFCQIDPDSLNADTNTYWRYTRWRQTRTLAQLLANLGASFKADELIFKADLSRTGASLYHPDYRTDFDLGDDPYRYYRW